MICKQCKAEGPHVYGYRILSVNVPMETRLCFDCAVFREDLTPDPIALERRKLADEDFRGRPNSDDALFEQHTPEWLRGRLLLGRRRFPKPDKRVRFNVRLDNYGGLELVP